MNLHISPNALDNLKDAPYPDVCTIQETQQILGIGRVSVYNLIESGKLRAFRIGRAYKIPKKAIREFLEERIDTE